VFAVGASDGIDDAEPAHSEGGDYDANPTRPCIAVRCNAGNGPRHHGHRNRLYPTLSDIEVTTMCTLSLLLTCVAGIQLVTAPHKAQPLLLYQLV
jgi:hypothetical protein